MTDPTVGSIVHFQGANQYQREDGSWGLPGGCRAAIVTEASDTEPSQVGLRIFHPYEEPYFMLRNGGVAEDQATHADGTWHWPEGTV